MRKIKEFWASAAPGAAARTARAGLLLERVLSQRRWCLEAQRQHERSRSRKLPVHPSKRKCHTSTGTLAAGQLPTSCGLPIAKRTAALVALLWVSVACQLY